MTIADKIKSQAELGGIIDEARCRGKTVVLANGCFDLIHAGHVRYLRGAAAEGGLLIVAINSDVSVRRLKGAGRPLMDEYERAELVASMECVDFVTVFHESTVDGLLLALRPDVHAKGTDYTAGNVPERRTVCSYGGRVAIVGDPKDHSTRDLIKTILAKFAR